MPLHHIELWVADSAEALDDWRWLLSSAGYERSAAWAEGETWSDGGVYLTLTGSPHLVDARHDRRRPGVNHLAFVVGGAWLLMRSPRGISTATSTSRG